MTLGASYFDGQYAASADPWGFTSRWYERRKYAISVAMLPSARYRSAFEPGCSIGELTAMLAPRFPAAAHREDRALVATLRTQGRRVLRTPLVTVVTSARATYRAPAGFGHHLTTLGGGTGSLLDAS